MIEIERTYLVKKVPENLEGFSNIKIKQGYLSLPPSPLRIRQKSEMYEITKKLPITPGDFSTAEEINIPLRKDEFNRLWPLVLKSLEKTRYLIPLSEIITAELDVFHGNLEGLYFVEVEFNNHREMGLFQPPSWFGLDVTEADFSANVFLAGRSFREIEEMVSKYKSGSNEN